jgi:hypothetical protein
MTASTLYKVDIDIDLSSNPKVRDMFTDPKREVLSFLEKNKVTLNTSSKASGEITHIEARGPSDALINFVDQFLSDDAPGGVYTLWYPR